MLRFLEPPSCGDIPPGENPNLKYLGISPSANGRIIDQQLDEQ